ARNGKSPRYLDGVRNAPVGLIQLRATLRPNIMTTSRELTSKESIVDCIQRMPEDATLDDAIERLKLLKAVAEGVKAAEEGRYVDHDELFDELLGKDAEDPNKVDGTRKSRSARAAETNHRRRPKKSARVRQKAKAGRE